MEYTNSYWILSQTFIESQIWLLTLKMKLNCLIKNILKNFKSGPDCHIYSSIQVYVLNDVIFIQNLIKQYHLSVICVLN